MMTWSNSFASARQLFTSISCGGQSISLLFGTRAAGCASQVGYQNDRISRLAWYRAPAPPSNPSNDGGLRKRVFILGWNLTFLRCLQRRVRRSRTFHSNMQIASVSCTFWSLVRANHPFLVFPGPTPLEKRCPEI